jgi:purine nucleosidase
VPSLTEAEVSGRQQVIIDTDPGIDDAMALCFLRSSSDISIDRLTTVFGNADVAVTTANAALLCHRFGIIAPIHEGAGAPLVRPRSASPVHVHGHDGLGDIGVDRSRASPISPIAAAVAIADRINDAPGRIRLLALGPLTNLARALELDPSIAEKARDVVIMGGAFGWHGRRGNVTPHAEANIWNDPHAAQRVLDASWRVTMVGLDVTSRCVLTATEAKRLAATGGDDARFLFDISRGYESLYRESDGLEGCCLHDVAAAMFLVAPELFTLRHGRITITTEGDRVGMSSQDDSNYSRHRTCVNVAAEQLLKTYAETVV